MTEVFRIAREKYVRDISGEGARLYGGRWNRKGTALLYASESRSLAVVEFLVHVPIALAPDDVRIARLALPADAEADELTPDRLPAGWDRYPAPEALADLGSAWALKNKRLVLKVPSTVVAGERNCLVNPAHKLFPKVRILDVEPFEASGRIFGNKKKSRS
ncbi:MAG: RES family NAD+ phosphorylase [Spirochaetales bacterium]|nr:RES family NAD+ phosphorylase [Spirochaetales bacterium]